MRETFPSFKVSGEGRSVTRRSGDPAKPLEYPALGRIGGSEVLGRRRGEPSSSRVFAAMFLAGLAEDKGIGIEEGEVGEGIVGRVGGRVVVLCNNWNTC